MKNLYRKFKGYFSFVKNIKKKFQYFGDETNLHGVRYVFSVNAGWFKRLFWLAVLICTSYGAARMFLQSLKVLKSNTISHTVETSYLDWETPFPAVTMCEQLDTDRIHSYLHSRNIPLSMAAFYKEISFWNSKFCLQCASCKQNVSCSQNIAQAVKDFKLKCQEMFTECWWDDKLFPCCERFKPLQTEYGLCYSFNSALTGNDTQIIHLSRRTGLRDLVFTVNCSSLVRVHSPYETISVASENYLGKQSQLPLVTEFQAFLKVEETKSDIAVTRLPAQDRGCLLWWERPQNVSKWNVKRYSYSACLLNCRSVAQADRCNCTHHFLPLLEGVPSCGTKGLTCLNKAKSLHTVKCNCPMACDEELYTPVHVYNIRYNDFGLLTDELERRGTRGRVQLANLPTLRVRRQAIRDTLSLVVDVGGLGGVFFGASVLSVIEIVYLIFIRRT